MTRRWDYKMKIQARVLTIISSITVLVVMVLPVTILAIPADAPAGSTAEQRLQQRKKEQNVQLDSKEILRVTGRCINAQNTIRGVQDKLSPVIKNRAAVYKRIDAKLWIVIGQLKLADKDTFKLEQQRAEFTKQVAIFDNLVLQYKQTLDDLVVMNCKADPTGFIAQVRTAREYHTLIRQQSKDINAYIVDTVKAKLLEFAQELQPKPATEGEN